MATDTQAQAERPSSRPAQTPVAAPPAVTSHDAGKPKGGSSDGTAAKKSKGAEIEGKKSKGSSSKSTKAAPEASRSPSVAAHPRAARAVARAKGWGGLGGFVIAGYLSLPTGTLAEAGVRALVAGSVCYVAAWAGAVFVWRRLVVIEIKGREQQLLASAHEGLERGEPQVAAGERSRARAA